MVNDEVVERWGGGWEIMGVVVVVVVKEGRESRVGVYGGGGVRCGAGGGAGGGEVVRWGEVSSDWLSSSISLI